MPDDAEITLDHFLGLQHVTFAYAGHDGLLCVDGKVYRFTSAQTACPQRGTGWNSSTKHSRWCWDYALGKITAVTEEEWESIDAAISPRRVDRMVMFHRHDEQLIYAIDETWGTETSGKVVIEIGTTPIGDGAHTAFVFTFNFKEGYVPSWWPKESLGSVDPLKLDEFGQSLDGKPSTE